MKTCIKNYFSQGPLLIIGKVFLFTLLLNFIYRIAFYFIFSDATTLNSTGDLKDLIYSLYLALKFDIRLSVLVVFPFFLLWPIFKKIKERIYRIFWFVIYFIFYLLLYLVFIFDFIHFDYLNERLSFSSIRFLNDFNTSLEVGLGYYPVTSIVISLFVFLIIVFFVLKNIFPPIKNTISKKLGKLQYCFLYFSIFFIMALGVYGKLAPPPSLRWSDTYVLKNSFLIKATLNPLLYFYDSSLWKSVTYDLNAVKKIYPHMKGVLGISNKENTLSFNRIIKASPVGKLDQNTNVVVVIMESLVKHRTSLMNPMNSTPHLKKIAKKGVYFNNFYTSTMGTARGIFSTLASVPDPSFGHKGTASRNNDLPKQNSAINALTNYKKFYFLGGSLNWAQMRALIRKAIPDIKLFEEGSYKRPNTDVWGLSDLDLVIEADKVFKKQKKPFIAILQFASFHRPFSIPKDKKSFVLEKHSSEVLKENGFRHLKEYNSLRFSDYSLNYLMKLAKEAGYFDNTLFVILGDHGGAVKGKALSVPQYIKDFHIGFSMTPLIFYAPKKLKPKIHSNIALQVDVLPSIVAALGRNAVATGFGINLFNQLLKREYAFMQIGPEISIVYLDKILKYNIEADKVIKTALLNPYILKKVKNFPHTNYLKNQIKNLHETMKYLLFNNQEITNESKNLEK